MAVVGGRVLCFVGVGLEIGRRVGFDRGDGGAPEGCSEGGGDGVGSGILFVDLGGRDDEGLFGLRRGGEARVGEGSFVGFGGEEWVVVEREIGLRWGNLGVVGLVEDLLDLGGILDVRDHALALIGILHLFFEDVGQLHSGDGMFGKLRQFLLKRQGRALGSILLWDGGFFKDTLPFIGQIGARRRCGVIRGSLCR